MMNKPQSAAVYKRDNREIQSHLNNETSSLRTKPMAINYSNSGS
jgi:hypothetical protein